MKLLDLILENQSLFSLLSENGRIEILKSKFVNKDMLDEYEFDKIVSADPTRNKTYAQWLLNQYVKEVIKPFKGMKSGPETIRSNSYLRAYRVFMEDLDGIRDSLLIFDKFKRKFAEKDINKYSVANFKKAALEVSDTLSDTEKAGGEHRFSADEKKFPEYKIGEVNGFTVWKLPQGRREAEAAACELGQDTSWCTRNGAFNTYNRKDPLYIFIGKGTKYQFHFSDNQFKNRVDEDMPDGPLKDSFFDFLEKYEGRVRGKKDISGYKIGEYDSPQGKLPIYKIGKDKYYTKVGDQEVFYNPDDGLLKYKGGNTISKPSVIFAHPYMDFLREVYNQLKKEGTTKGFKGIYRLLLNLDIPETPKDGWVLPSDLTLIDSQLTELPEGLHVKGSLNLDGSSIKRLPSRLRVDGDLDLTDTGITEIPPGVKVGGKIEGLKEKSK